MHRTGALRSEDGSLVNVAVRQRYVPVALPRTCLTHHLSYGAKHLPRERDLVGVVQFIRGHVSLMQGRSAAQSERNVP
jgi:hypothetical protein